MPDRPYTLASCGMSMDGYLDAGTRRRLLLSNADDLRRVDAVRAGCDAILVGAETIRRDDPRLAVRSESHRSRRRDRGWPASPVKVTVTASGDLDAGSLFFAEGTGDKLVYCAGPAAASVRRRLGRSATVVDAGRPVRMRAVAEDLHARGLRRLMVEGGSSILTQFLADDLVDELHLVIAPLFVGNPGARRFVGDGHFPWNPDRRARLAGVEQIGDVVLLTYALSPRFSPQRVTVP